MRFTEHSPLSTLSSSPTPIRQSSSHHWAGSTHPFHAAYHPSNTQRIFVHLASRMYRNRAFCHIHTIPHNFYHLST